MKIHGLYVRGKGFLRTASGTMVAHIAPIAGKDTGTIFRDAWGFAAAYGGQPENWQKKRGEVVLICDGKNRRAETHWVQEDGMDDFFDEKFIRWLEK